MKIILASLAGSAFLALPLVGCKSTPSPVTSPSSTAVTASPVKTTAAPVKTTENAPLAHKTTLGPAAPVPPSCYPIASSGNCYEPGEFCPAKDRGTSGIAGDGKSITCEDNNGWRWED